MKNIIIMSPSKEMIELSKNFNISLKDETKTILNSLKKLNIEEIEKYFKISTALATLNYNRFHSIETSCGNIALKTYNGIAFKNMNLKNFTDEDFEFAYKNLIILSALYGPIFSKEIISPYRLDFNVPIKIDNLSLKNFWENYYNNFFKDYSIYNLASYEFSSFINKEISNFIDIEFFEDFEKNKHAHSTTVKKLRGALAAEIIKNKSFEKEIFKNFSYLEFRLSEEYSNTNRIVYVKSNL
ncbi:YaaA family protein [Peptoniphilus sp. oral taxon 386]|uniref:YaaA family protein n=1 Tax=Peptoniphilus sp. oral taxon 386 TaxID=652713 RepID=UPI00030D0102|nr:YaaA family protein [Peptoniphilus sp. oral taxon 386]